MGKYAVLCLDEMRVALSLPCMERVVRAAYLTPLPVAPEIVLGIINIEGHVIPVFNMRRRFRLAQRDMALNDRLVIANSKHRTVALLVDGVDGIAEYKQPDIVSPETIVPGLEYVNGVVKLKDGLILIHDLDRFLSLEETASLDRALAMQEVT